MAATIMTSNNVTKCLEGLVLGHYLLSALYTSKCTLFRRQRSESCVQPTVWCLRNKTLIFMDGRRNQLYAHRLEKYREVDEDEILSNLTKEELEQLEGEIDREVLNKIPEDIEEEVEDSSPSSSSSSANYSSSSEDEIETWPRQQRPKLSTIQTKHLNRSLEKQYSREKMEAKRKSSKTSHQFKLPTLRKAKSREEIKRQKSEEEGEMKKELIQAVKRRTKKRTNRANSSGLSRRYNRRNSSSLFRSRRPKVAKEEKKDANVNKNYITAEMLMLRPRLKKVHTREPAKVVDMLHGVPLGHITSGVKSKDEEDSPDDDDDDVEDEDDLDEGGKEEKEDPDSDVVTSDADSSLVDEAVANANDNVHRRFNARVMTCDAVNDDTTSCTTAGSTSAESYDVIGELSINSNSVEEMLSRIREDDRNLTEVNLNNIQNVNMEVFEELATAMESNTIVKQLNLANVGLTDKPVRALAVMLKRNKTLEKLNVESNFITGEAALRLVKALRKNRTLSELRIDNQRHIFGAKTEHEISKILKDNRTLLRFGYQFHNPGPRMAVSNSLTRNMDEVRKRRVIEQRRKIQTNRPIIRRQPSSEWRNKEEDEKLRHKTQEDSLLSQLQDMTKTEDVTKFIQQIEPAQYAVLEQWFADKLLGNTGNSASLRSKNDKKVPHKAEKASLSRREPSPREKLLDSIRNSGRSTPVQKNFNQQSEFPNHEPAKELTVPHQPERTDQQDRNSHRFPNSNQQHENVEVQSNDALEKEELIGEVHEEDVLIPWQEGEEYDSDEYEVIEIVIGESDEVSSDLDACQRSSHKTLPPDRSKYGYSNDGRVPDDRNLLHDSSLHTVGNDSSSTSCNLYPRRNYQRDQAVDALDRLRLADSRPTSSNSGETSLGLGLKISPDQTASLSSSPSVSPTTPRPVKDDESWIIRKPHYRLGAK